ncbi:MAG TPA: CdaR family protein [Melioribacteraceae bacterium]|nr:CdaR family protein [Melioribacteraceae bacterium]
MKKKLLPFSIILIFSIIMWGSISLSGEFVATFKVPVTLIDLPRNYTKGSISDKEIYLRIRSKGWELAKLSLAGDEEFLVSAKRRSGKHKVNLRDEMENNAWLTSNYRVIEIAPNNIEFEVDRIITKKVKVRQNTLVEFKEGFGIASKIKITPEEIEISGSANQLKDVDTVFTEYLELKDLSEPVNSTLNLVPVEDAIFSHTSCTIEFDVQKIVDKSFDEIPVEIRNVPQSKELILFPGKISVVLKGGINKLGRLTRDSIQAYVDFWTVLRNEEEGVEPEIKIPENTTLIDIIPKKLEYIIKQY